VGDQQRPTCFMVQSSCIVRMKKFWHSEKSWRCRGCLSLPFLKVLKKRKGSRQPLTEHSTFQEQRGHAWDCIRERSDEKGDRAGEYTMRRRRCEWHPSSLQDTTYTAPNHASCPVSRGSPKLTIRRSDCEGPRCSISNRHCLLVPSLVEVSQIPEFHVGMKS